MEAEVKDVEAEQETILLLRMAIWRAIEDVATVRCAIHSSEVQARELLVAAEMRLRAALELAR